MQIMAVLCTLGIALATAPATLVTSMVNLWLWTRASENTRWMPVWVASFVPVGLVALLEYQHDFVGSGFVGFGLFAVLLCYGMAWSLFT